MMVKIIIELVKIIIELVKSIPGKSRIVKIIHELVCSRSSSWLVI